MQGNHVNGNVSAAADGGDGDLGGGGGGRIAIVSYFPSGLQRHLSAAGGAGINSYLGGGAGTVSSLPARGAGVGGGGGGTLKYHSLISVDFRINWR